jgi:polyhydroxybutyrate depolymerase
MTFRRITSMTGAAFACGVALLLGNGLCRAELAPGDYSFALKHQNRERSYIVHVPVGPPSTAWPVVINLHGGGGHAKAQQRYSRMDVVADREGFLVVYPNGTGAFGSRLLTWNAGSCCGWAQKNEVDDVGFARVLIEDLARRIPIDPARIYATGLSNGAMMSYRLAVEAPDLIAAIAPVAGAMVCLPFKAGRPISILHIHSVDDPRALYAGGLGPPFPFTNLRVLHAPVEGTIAHWVEFDGCAPSPKIQPELHGTGRSAKHTATLITYAPCNNGTEVALWKLTGSGHVWPGGEMDYLNWALGPGTDVIDANAQIWRFFSHIRLDR